MSTLKKIRPKAKLNLGACWVIVFFAANLAAQFTLIHDFSGALFLTSLISGAAIILFKFNTVFKDLSKVYTICFWFVVVLLVYQLTIGLTIINDDKAMEYTIAKPVVLLATVFFAQTSNSHLQKRIFKMFAIMGAALIAYGIAFNPAPPETLNQLGGRQMYGFGNPNSLGAIGSIVFGIALILTDSNKYLRYAIMAIGVFAVLRSGSRSAMGICVIAFIAQYGFNKRFLIYLVATIAIFMVYSRFSGTQMAGIERMAEATEESSIFEGRGQEREATILMIKQKPWTGNGVYAGQSEEAKEISELGSHSFYLDMLKWYGVPIGLLLLFAVIWPVIKIAKLFYKSKDILTKCALFITIAVMIAANFEAYIWGVNQMITTIFFIALCVMQKKYYIATHQPRRKKTIPNATLSLPGSIQ